MTAIVEHTLKIDAAESSDRLLADIEAYNSFLEMANGSDAGHWMTRMA